MRWRRLDRAPPCRGNLFRRAGAPAHQVLPADTADETTPAPATEPTAAPAETPAATDTEPTTVAANTTTEPVAAGTPIPAGIYVQVSAQGTEAAAQSTLQDFLNRAPSILGGEPTAIDRAELTNGTYYRVLFGPYSSADAQSLMQRLAAVGIDAFIQRY